MKYIFANWKMYLGVKESIALAKGIADSYRPKKDREVALFPSALAMTGVISACKQAKIPVGAQNCAWAPAGAYTGAISAQLFADVGCTYALVGHSERRHVFGDSDTSVRKKFEACLEAGLIPILCIGETKEEKEQGKREYRLKKQLFTALDNAPIRGKKFFIAYEPVWAIGTGDACAPADADDVHGWIRQEIRKYSDVQMPILYGGSADAKNAGTYLARETIGGLLIGSASVNAKSFLSIAKAV